MDIIKDNDHGYLIPYPAYEHNKKMFQETQAPAAGEYLNATEDIQADNAEIRALAESITAGLSSDYEKASAIYDWMGQNIAYDYETYHAVDDESQRPQDAVSVMNQRSAVCAGYSQLAAALLRSIGIPTKYVLGFPSLDYGIGETTDDWIKILMNGRRRGKRDLSCRAARLERGLGRRQVGHHGYDLGPHAERGKLG